MSICLCSWFSAPPHLFCICSFSTSLYLWSQLFSGSIPLCLVTNWLLPVLFESLLKLTLCISVLQRQSLTHFSWQAPSFHCPLIDPLHQSLTPTSNRLTILPSLVPPSLLYMFYISRANMSQPLYRHAHTSSTHNHTHVYTHMYTHTHRTKSVY